MKDKITFKCDISDSSKEFILNTVQNLKNKLRKIIPDAEKEFERLYKVIKQEIDFWNKNTKPVYRHAQRKLDPSKSYEVNSIWLNTGAISSSTKEEISVWACPYCKQKISKKYIATGHDHTDHSYDVCDCEGAAASGGKHWDKLS